RPIFLRQIDDYEGFPDDDTKGYLLQKALYVSIPFAPNHVYTSYEVLPSRRKVAQTDDAEKVADDAEKLASTDESEDDFLFPEFSEFDPANPKLPPFSTISVLLCPWVDDIVLTGPAPAFLDSIARALHDRFPLSDGGALTHIRGIEVLHDCNAKVFLPQRQYIEHILNRFNHTSCHADPLPLNPSAISTLQRTDVAPAAEKTRYAELIGSLIYLSTRTGPDIAPAVGFLSRSTANPSATHWNALRHGVTGTLSAMAHRRGAMERALEGAVDGAMEGAMEGAMAPLCEFPLPPWSRAASPAPDAAEEWPDRPHNPRPRLHRPRSRGSPRLPDGLPLRPSAAGSSAETAGYLSLPAVPVLAPYAQAPRIRNYTRKNTIYISQAEPDTTGLMGWALLLCTYVAFVALGYAAVVSKFMPRTGNKILDYISDDNYYSVLIPVTLPVAIFWAFFNWLGLKTFRTN
ncbi:MAG: phosphatidylinositol N-acetylglucosaminyltransferase subunit Y-domain-containing protein, partial [Olpidium bornovanus]